MSDSSILIVEDDAGLREALKDTLELSGYTVLEAANGNLAMDLLESYPVSMVVADVQMEGMDGHTLLKQIKRRWAELPVVLMTAYGTIEKAVEAMRDGAVDYMVKPFEAEVLVNMVSRYALSDEESELVAEDPRTRELVELGRRVADTDATVMITGESGSGKEVFARDIHRHSGRAEGPFVAINCAAIPENMLEAVLFGYEKGAFTGAYKSSPGKFEQANGGTLLLDEISEMDLGLQAKLLRVLQEREVERLGGSKLIPLDVRVLATSNRNMRGEVDEGNFREDLYYRLNVFPLHLLPLRERTQDIIPLARYLITRHLKVGGRAIPEISEQAQASLLSHSWPGNVRELDNVVQRALILCRGDAIDAGDILFEPESGELQTSLGESVPAATAVLDNGSLGDSLKSREQRLILEALKEGNGSRKFAADKLGISQRTLRYKLARMRDAGVSIPTRGGL